MKKQDAAVLLVDDDSTILNHLGQIFAKLGFSTVIKMRHGLDAIRETKSKNYELVCLDIHLPDVTGLEVLQEIRKNNKDVKVVMISGDATAQIVNQALELGANGFVCKPFSPDKIIKALKHVARQP